MIRRLCSQLAGCAFALTLVSAPALHAQTADRSAPPHSALVVPLVTLGSEADVRLRLDQVLGEAATTGYLIRSPSRLAPPLAYGGPGLRYAVLAPEFRAVWNSQIPLSLNDGAMWAGRGVNAKVLTGAALGFGRVSLIVAPEVVYAQNRLFTDTPPMPEDDPFQPPWQRGVHSVDLPLRFGDESSVELFPGQSTLALDLSPVVLGVSTENQWWGPGQRNAIVMSNNAPGFPHGFVGTARPAETAIGALEARWILGWLSPSGYFNGAEGGRRSLSGLVLTYQPVFERNLTLGTARAVYSPLDDTDLAPGRFFDVLTRRGADGATVLPSERHAEQVMSVFGRWVLPEDGVEVYAEWGRRDLPRNFRDLLVEPNHTQGYTLGLQWARPLGEQGARFRFQTELTQLEQSPSLRRRPVGSWYASPSIPHGYTHRGQVVGAAIGPAGSSQWVGGEYLAPTWSLGFFGGRTRWANDAFYDRPRDLPGSDGRVPRVTNLAHDVSLYGGVRTSFRLVDSWLQTELTVSNRMNYMWQNYAVNWETSDDAVDIRNLTLRFSYTPVVQGR
jgi:hypothetical protein